MLKPLARLILRMGGWTMIGSVPDLPKAVYIAAPHTSNWDGFWALVYKVAVGLDIRFFAKNSLFWFPLNIILGSMGGIALDRGQAGSAVQRAVDRFQSEDEFIFGLAPEGTRSLTPGWKTGFYRIAQQANVPVVPGFLDFGRRQIGLGEPYELTGDVDTDIAHFAALYADVEGRWPEKASPVQFRK